MSTTQKLYRTLHDQLEHALYPAALKTCQRILRIDSQDALALSTQLQLFIALERYPQALQSEQTTSLDKAYCLYKSGRANDAKAFLEQQDELDFEEDRGAKVVLAQVDYRLGNYEASRDAFDDLANTAETDSPELPDLQHNSEICSTHLSFLSSVPSLVSSTDRTGSTSIEDLESRPLTLVLPSQPRSRPVASTSNLKQSTTDGQEKDKVPKSRSKRPLKHFNPDKLPVEDRWIPKRQRPSMRDQLLQKKEKARGKKKEKVALTQGSAAVETKQDEVKGTPSKTANSGGNNKGGKKKKGKK